MARRRFFRSLPSVSKRNKFVLSTTILTVGLIFAFLLGPNFANQSVGTLALCAALFTLFSLWGDLPKRKQAIITVLPAILFTIACGLFYFILPARWITRIIMFIIFAFGFYAILLVQNIYAISVARTIKLLQAARTIGFLLAVTSAFGLYYILFSLHTVLPVVVFGIAIVSFLLIIGVIWSVSLREFFGKTEFLHALVLTLVLTEIGAFITFWPVSVTFEAIFLAGNFYTFVGLSQHWLENRLFKRVLWEFIWVAVILFVILFFTAKWGG
jgi:hypothetical protein